MSRGQRAMPSGDTGHLANLPIIVGLLHCEDLRWELPLANDRSRLAVSRFLICGISGGEQKYCKSSGQQTSFQLCKMRKSGSAYLRGSSYCSPSPSLNQAPALRSYQYLVPSTAQVTGDRTVTNILFRKSPENGAFPVPKLRVMDSGLGELIFALSTGSAPLTTVSELSDGARRNYRNRTMWSAAAENAGTISCSHSGFWPLDIFVGLDLRTKNPTSSHRHLLLPVQILRIYGNRMANNLLDPVDVRDIYSWAKKV
ncbi:hypothetical protein DFH08DRAFT_800179 [Mycena albidolilacea]|uniref:Uncharacterized protein n=1 Tax=Mycena albidolilacea TaxID=1033008 RepID=A0AAD7AJ90_9AGAR|nr:hypothetical protein DFH08DRAFT_800179 [Mycena albidolilacea]